MYLAYNQYVLGAGQGFTGNGGKVTSAKFWVDNQSITGVRAEIYAHSGTWGSTGVPTGSPLAVSDVKDSGDGNGDGTTIFNFSGSNQLQTVAGQKYFIVLALDENYPDHYNGVVIEAVSSPSVTSGGNSALDEYDVWGVNGGVYLLFELYGTAPSSNYLVTYDGNGNTGGSVPTDSNLYVQGASVTVAANPNNLVKSGSIFVGWATSSSAGAPSFAVTGSTVNPPSFNMPASNVTLYAVWQTISTTFTITYNGTSNTSGSVPTNNTTYTTNSTVPVTHNSGNLVRTNYKFMGWTRGTSAPALNSTPEFAVTGTTVTPSNFVMGTSNITLYAVWWNMRTLTYNDNNSTNGSVPTDSNAPYVNNSTVTVLDNTGNLTRTDYTFLGWATTSNATSPNRIPGTTFTITANTTLYAVWQANPTQTYKITYNGNGHTGGNAPVDYNNYLAGAPVTVSNAGTLVKTNHAFKGWAYSPTAQTPDFTVINNAVNPYFFLITTNTTLYAIWSPASGSPTPINQYDQIVLRTNPASVIGREAILKRLWGFENGVWETIDFKGYYGKSWITITEENTTPTDDPNINLFMIKTPPPDNNPLFVVDRGMAMQKDLAVGGSVAAHQGALWLGSGLRTQVDGAQIILVNSHIPRLGSPNPIDNCAEIPKGTQWPPTPKHYQLYIRTDAIAGNSSNSLYKYNDDNPSNKHWECLGPISNFNGTFDTLHIRKRSDSDEPAHLDVGNISIHGHLNVGNTVTSSLHPAPGLALGHPANMWLGVVADTIFTKNIAPIATPYGFGDRIEVNSKLKINNSIECTNVIQGGGNSGNAFKVGDDIYLVDINQSNRLSLQGAQNTTQAGIQFGQDGVWLFRHNDYIVCEPSSGNGGFSVNGFLVVSSWVNTSQHGPLYKTSSGQIGYSVSSERFKENISTIEDCSWLFNLRPVFFNWKDRTRSEVEGKQLGLLAEEVYRQCPQLVWLDDKGNPEGAHYEWLGVPLIIEVRKLKREIDELKTKLAAANKKEEVI